MILKWTMIFWTGYMGNNNTGILFSPVLGLKSGNKKVKGGKKKKDKEKLWGDKKKTIERESGISKVSINYYEIYKWVNK